MNLVGKIFVMLILVLSLVFMGLSIAVYATHKNWKDVVMRAPADAKPGEPVGLRFQLDEAKAKNADLQVQFTKLQADLDLEKAARAEQVRKLETEKELERKEKTDLANERAAVDQERRDALAAVREKQALLDAKIQEGDALRNDIAKAHDDRDIHFKQVVDATDALNQATGELERLKERNTLLAEQMARARLVLNRHDLDENMPVDRIPPKLDGIVLKSSADGLVEISLGSDDGLTKGQQLVAYRINGGESKFLGKIEVLKTLPDKSVAKVVPGFMKSRIEKEDRVATRLN